MADSGLLRARDYQANDLAQLISLARCGLSSSPGQGYAHPGDVVWREYRPRAMPRHRDDARVWFDASGLAAHAVFETPARLAFLTRPDIELAPLVEEVIAWAEERRKASQDAAGASLSTVVLSGDQERIGILGDLGFAAGRSAAIQFSYRLDAPLPASLLPSGARLRPAAEADVEARVNLHRRAWSVWGPSDATPENYRRMRSAPLYDPELDIVVELRGQLLSYCICWADPDSGTGLLGPAGTHRDYIGEGYARAVLADGLRRLRDRGLQTAYIGIDAGNARGLALYPTFGFKEVDSLTAYERRD